MDPLLGEDSSLFRVHGTEILPTDTPQQYRQKVARITLDSMVQFVGLLDVQGTVREINKVALDAVGIKLSDVEGQPFWRTFWWQVSEEINATLRHSIARAAKGEFVRWDTPIYGRAGGTETIIIDASLCPVMDDCGEVVFICAEGRDITEKKAQEKEITQKNIELQGLLERIRELDEIKAQFFANVSHELRTPLQLVIGPADRLSQDDATMRPEQRQQSARVIARNARMLLKHVNDLLDISKFEAGKLNIALQDTNVTSLLRVTASHFDLLAEERHITFLIEAHDEVVSAIDPEKLQRVVMNLLSNAFKFVPDLGKVRATLRASEKEFVISIEDSGPGVKPELRHAIFERFRQGEGGTNRQFGGTGLGLAIAKEFIDLHHGGLEVRDSELGGACFQVTLPIARLSPAVPPSTVSSAHQLEPAMIEGFIHELSQRSSVRDERTLIDPLESSKSTVVVVEDNPDMNRFITESLSDTYHVISAFDGQQGLEKALASSPTLIITDIMMPKVSGVQMIAEIRKYPELADVPILLLSAKADEELKIQLLTEGAHDFVAKPFSEKDLLVRVRNLIKLKQSQDRYRAFSVRLEQIVQERTEELEQSQNRLRALATELNLAEQRERKRIAGDLHDHLAQLLVVGRLNLGRMRRIGLSPQGEEMVNDTEGVLNKALEYTRTLMAELSPPVLQEHGLPAGLKWLGEQMQRNGLVVTVNVDDAVNCVLPDNSAVLLFQSVRELLMNALKHAHTKEVSIRLDSTEESLHIEVRDAGSGFDLAAAGSAKTNTALSSKFGLFSIRERMIALGGSFDVHSVLGDGTTATLTLPLGEVPGRGTEAAATESAQELKRETHSIAMPAARPMPHAPSRIRVLLVDDHAMVRQGLRSVLESYADVEIVGEASSGDEALACVERLHPAIVVMDINMPTMNGIEATTEIKSHDPGVIVIGLSVQAGGANEVAMMSAGAVMLLTKEAAVDELYRAIRNTLDSKGVKEQAH